MTETDAQALASAFLAAWAKAINQADWGALGLLFADDAIFVATTPQPCIGPAAIVRYYREAPAGLQADYALEVARSSGRDDVRALASVRFTLPGGERAGRLTICLLRQPDDMWLATLYHAAL